jgi:hypothetical protein
MAKKHSPDHKPYSPVDVALMQSLPTVLSPTLPEEERAPATLQEPEARAAPHPPVTEDEEDAPSSKVVQMPLSGREPLTMPAEQPKHEPATPSVSRSSLNFRSPTPSGLRSWAWYTVLLENLKPLLIGVTSHEHLP